MDNPLAFGIFLVRRSSGEVLILHPFRPGSAVFRDPDRITLDGRYATEPGPGDTEIIRKTLHSELEKGLRRDALDRGFYPRLLVSAAVFLLLYLFLSIVVRDPVPLVDELLAGGLGAVAAWFALERRSLSSETFARRSAALRRALDSAIFRPSRAARYLEEVLQDAETLDPDRLADYPASMDGNEFSVEEVRELEEVAAALETFLPADCVEEANRTGYGPDDMPRLIRRLTGRRTSDLPMMLSYLRIKSLGGVEK